VDKSDGTIVEHTYDADGARVQTITTPSGGSAATTNFLVDTSGSLSHVVAETDGAGALVVHYVRGDDLLALMRPPAGSPTPPIEWLVRYYHADHIGSVRRLTNESGQITDGYRYSAFGELLAHTGSDPQPYAFTGEPYDPNIGFQYHRARWMDPRVGRFVGMDPFRGNGEEPGSLHRYLYASAEPVGRIDPSGRMAVPIQLEIGRKAHELISIWYGALGGLIDTGPGIWGGGLRLPRWRTDIRFIRDAGVAGGVVLFPGSAGEVYEIKSKRQQRLGAASLALMRYIDILGLYTPDVNWRPGDMIIPVPPAYPGELVHPSLRNTVMVVTLEAPGEIAYEFVPLLYDPEGQAELELAEGVLTAGLAIGALTAYVANAILLSAAAGF
jgi:RHS repeat-associated protein